MQWKTEHTTQRVINMIVYRQPVATPRPRVTRFGKVYYPKNYKEYVKQLKADFAELDIPSGALDIHITFVMKRPQSFKRRGDRVIHTKRPDLDNLAKGVLDSLPIKDDARVVKLTAVKWYAAAGENPHLLLRIKQFEQQKNTPQ